jgi:hypothetical protein
MNTHVKRYGRVIGVKVERRVLSGCSAFTFWTKGGRWP